MIAALDERVILVQRDIEPGIGKWCLPGGLMEPGEKPEETAIRETFEETGLQVQIQRLLGVYFDNDEENGDSVVIVYAGHVTGGHFRCGAEVRTLKAYHPCQIPWNELAFPSTREALRDWLARCQCAPLRGN